MPATVAWADTSFWICVTFSRPPTIVLRPSTGPNAYRPFALPGFGAVTMRIATGPCGVNWTPSE